MAKIQAPAIPRQDPEKLAPVSTPTSTQTSLELCKVAVRKHINNLKQNFDDVLISPETEENIDSRDVNFLVCGPRGILAAAADLSDMKEELGQILGATKTCYDPSGATPVISFETPIDAVCSGLRAAGSDGKKDSAADQTDAVSFTDLVDILQTEDETCSTFVSRKSQQDCITTSLALCPAPSQLGWHALLHTRRKLSSILAAGLGPAGFVFKPAGLFIRILEVEHAAKKDEPLVFLSNDVPRILTFFGLDKARYDDGFATHDALFEWLNSCRYTSDRAFLHSTPTSADSSHPLSEASMPFLTEVFVDSIEFFNADSAYLTRLATLCSTQREALYWKSVTRHADTLLGPLASRAQRNRFLRSVRRWTSFERAHSDAAPQPTIARAALLDEAAQPRWTAWCDEGGFSEAELLAWIALRWKRMVELEQARTRPVRVAARGRARARKAEREKLPLCVLARAKADAAMAVVVGCVGSTGAGPMVLAGRGKMCLAAAKHEVIAVVSLMWWLLTTDPMRMMATELMIKCVIAALLLGGPFARDTALLVGMRSVLEMALLVGVLYGLETALLAVLTRVMNAWKTW